MVFYVLGRKRKSEEERREKGRDYVLSIGCLSRDCLLEVARQVLLEVEVGQLLGRIRHSLLVVLEKLLQLVIGKNETTILLGLEVVRPNISSDLLGDIGASHQRSTLAAEEDRKLVTDLGRLHEPTRSTIALVLVLLCVELVEHTKLLGHVLLHELDLVLEGTELYGEIHHGTVQVGKHVADGGHLGGDWINGLHWLRRNWGRSWGRRNLNGGLRWSTLRHLLGLL